MTVDFRGVSTASLGAMLKGYGVMAGVATRWPRARFWWTPAGTVATELAELDGYDTADAQAAIRSSVFELAQWASKCGKAFEKPRGSKNKGKAPGNPPLEGEATWQSLDASLAMNAEGVGVHLGNALRPNPVLARWGQDGSGNLFTVLREAGEKAKAEDIHSAIFGGDQAVRDSLSKGTGALFPEGIKRYATGTQWIHDKMKPVGRWDFILAVRGLLLLRGTPRTFRGSRHVYSSFPFVLPASVVKAQGSPETTDAIFLPTWYRDHPRTLAEYEAQMHTFQARVGRRDFVSGAADFRRAVAARAVTGGFGAFHHFVLEPRKPGRQKRQRQAIARGITKVGPAEDYSLRSLLAPLDDSGWLDRFRLRRIGGKVDSDSEKLALAKTGFDQAVHSAIDVPDVRHRVSVLKALWCLQFELWTLSERSRANILFRPAPLLEGSAWRGALSDLFEQERAARLGWALASLGWHPVADEGGQPIKRPIIEQLLPVQSVGGRGLQVPEADDRPGQRVRQLGRNPARELATLFWRRWIDTASLPVLPAMGTRHAHVEDVTALLRGEVSVRDLQTYFLAFLPLDGDGDTAPPPPASQHRSTLPSYAALRLWFDLSARARPRLGERRPMEWAVPRGIATGNSRSVADAARSALRRLRSVGFPGRWPEGTRPTGRRVAVPRVNVTSREAGLMAAAVLFPISSDGMDRLARTLLVPPAPQEHAPESKQEIIDVRRQDRP